MHSRVIARNCSGGDNSVLTTNLRGRNVIENEVDSSLASFVHHAMAFLIIDFINVADFHALWPAIDHEADEGIRVDRNVDAVPVVE